MKRTYTIIEFPQGGMPVLHTRHRKTELEKWLREHGIHEGSQAMTGQCIYITDDDAFVMVFDRRPRILSFAATLFQRQEARVGEEAQ